MEPKDLERVIKEIGSHFELAKRYRDNYRS